MNTMSNAPQNAFVHYIGPSPVTSFQPKSMYPAIDPTAFVGPFSSVIGDVTIKPHVFIAPHASIRADEGSPFYIGERASLQDGVILHGLYDERVEVKGRHYSIYIDRDVSITHGAIVHGPAYIGERSFVGFQSLVFQAIVGSNVYISSNAVVTGHIVVDSHRFVPPGAVIDTQQKADELPPIPRNADEFAAAVRAVNREFTSSYTLLFGNRRCSCGLACA